MSANEMNFIDREYQLAAHLRDSRQPIDSALDSRRVAVYRELTRNNIYGFIDNTFPLTRQILADKWPSLLDEFVRQHRCSSPLFLDIPAEFLAYMQQHYADGFDDKPFINELLHYEWIELDIATKQAEDLSPWHSDKDAILHCSQAAVALSYRYAVQHIAVDQLPQQAPEHATHLLVYRDHDDEVTFMEISALLVIALQLLTNSAGLTMEQWLAQLSQHCPQFPADVLSHGLGAIMPELSQRGIIGLATEYDAP
ncbi:hypothetical protein HR45_07880 [Shewanella mangrovi]|uniref:Uncharacterized protein n=1 Tax=Shewanella mangrovi TaxID=1515746 RepID=A0A094LRG7_9GAMM|nr:putative DNA-binding domain-containing protein [Shewanella mangrovi]KFZ37768.1 hypothetical protein HR45_07880 [Shewanella mangrovi]